MKAQRPTLIGVAWLAMLIVGLAPIIQGEFLSDLPSWRVDVVVIVGLLTLLALTFGWEGTKPLRGYVLILLVIILGATASSRVQDTAFWESLTGTSWAWESFAYQLLRLTQALLVMLVLVLMGLNRRDYFLVKGRLDAPAEPVRLLGMKAPQPWTQLGRNFAIIISLVTLTVLFLGFGPTFSSLGRLLPLFPVVLVIATMNAFSEEFPYRAALLSQLGSVGKSQAIWITAVVFGLAHFYGTPTGIAGVILAGFMGWFLGKSMVETKGFLWAWFIHFLQDVIIFSFFAMSVSY